MNVLRYNWIVLTAVILFILPACEDVVQIQEEKNLNELSFAEKVAMVSNTYDTPQDLFQDILVDIEKATSDKAVLSNKIREFDTTVRNIDFSSSSKFRDNQDVNLTVDLLAKSNPLGEKAFYKFIALGSKLIETNPEIVDMNKEELSSWIQSNLKVVNKSALSITNTTPQECRDECAETFAWEAAQASVLFSTGLIICGSIPPVTIACMAGVMGAYAIEYAFELAKYFRCLSKCPDDTLSEG